MNNKFEIGKTIRARTSWGWEFKKKQKNPWNNNDLHLF